MDSLDLDDQSAVRHVAKKGISVARSGKLPEILPGSRIALFEMDGGKR